MGTESEVNFHLTLTSDNIEEFSEGLFTGSRDIDLSHKGIGTLQDDIFQNLELEKLDLSHNILSDISAGVFKNSIIKSLSLAHNEFRSIKKTMFEGAEEIQFLSLKNNSIETIEPGSFSNMAKPAYVYLHDNLIEHIPDRLFNSNVFVELELAKNKIKSISPLAFEEAAVSYLNLSDNSLEEVKGDSFDGVLEIEYLILSNNNIKTIEPHALNKVCKGVKLDGNNLEVIEKDTLKFARVIVLLNNKYLRKIEVGAFDDSGCDPELFPDGTENLPRKLYLEKENSLDEESKEYLNSLVTSGLFEWHDKVADILFPFS